MYPTPTRVVSSLVSGGPPPAADWEVPSEVLPAYRVSAATVDISAVHGHRCGTDLEQTSRASPRAEIALPRQLTRLF